MGSQPVVLIARLDDGRSLYAVEREARGLYVLLHLGSWVDLHQLKAAAVVSKPDLSRVYLPSMGAAAAPEAVPLITPETSKYNKKKRLAIEAIQSMVKRPSATLSAEAIPIDIPLETSMPVVAQDLQQQEPSTTNAPLVDASQATASEIFDNVRTQYFEALYLSKVRKYIYIMLSASLVCVDKLSRRLWPTSQKVHYQEPVQHFTLTTIPPLT